MAPLRQIKEETDGWMDGWTEGFVGGGSKPMTPRSRWWGVSGEGGVNGETGVWGNGWEKSWKYVRQRCVALLLSLLSYY